MRNKYTLLIVAFVMLTLQAQSATTGYPWVTAGTYTRPTGSSYIWYVEVVRIGSWSGSLPSVTISSLGTGYNTDTITMNTARAALTTTGTDSHFDVIVGHKNSNTGLEKTPILTFHSVGQSWTRTYSTDSAAVETGIIRTYTITAVADGSEADDIVAFYQMQPGEATYNGSVTKGYPFTIAIGMTEAYPDRDNDTFPDNIDPYPDDATNAGWGADVKGDADGDGVENWDDEYPYDPTKGVAGPASGSSGQTGANPVTGQVAPYSYKTTLDNTQSSKDAIFYIQIIAKDDGAVLGQDEVNVAAGAKTSYTMQSDEDFLINVWKTIYIDGEPVTVQEVNGDTAINNGPTSTPLNGEAEGEVSEPLETVEGEPTAEGTPATEVQGLEQVRDAVDTLRTAVNTQGNKADQNAKDLKEAITEGADDIGEVVASDTGMLDIMDKLETIKGDLVAIGNAMTWTSNSQQVPLTFTFPSLANAATGMSTPPIVVDLEDHAELFDTLRGVELALMSMFFGWRLISIMRGSTADEGGS